MRIAKDRHASRVADRRQAASDRTRVIAGPYGTSPMSIDPITACATLPSGGVPGVPGLL